MSCGCELQEKSDKTLMIINTDPGIDDAQAVLMALSDPDVEILAICVQYGNASIEHTLPNILKLLTAINRTDVPVFRGCERSLVGKPRNADNYFGKDGFGGYDGLPSPDYSLVQPEHAVVAMVRLVREYPDQITLLSLAPATNLAMALRLDPDFSKRLKNCFIMGGNYKGVGNITRSGEFNFYNDAEAAEIVLSGFGCRIYIFTWELCVDSEMSWEFHDYLLSMSSVQAKLIKNLEAKLIDGWKSKGKHNCCDVLAMAAALNQNCIVECRERSAEVECNGLLTRGQMVVDWANVTKKPQNICIVEKLNMELVKTLLKRAYSE